MDKQSKIALTGMFLLIAFATGYDWYKKHYPKQQLPSIGSIPKDTRKGEHDSVLKMQYGDSYAMPTPANSHLYPNITKTRNVVFNSLIPNVATGKYFIGWMLWVDGEAVENGEEFLELDEIEQYKHKIRRQCNELIPKIVEMNSHINQ